MSYDRNLLFRNISAAVKNKTSTSLRSLSHQIKVGTRTIEKAVKTCSGKTFREFHSDMVLSRIVELLTHDPALSIKQLSFALDYKSPRAFARAVKRMCNLRPTQLRSLVACGHFGQEQIPSRKHA